MSSDQDLERELRETRRELRETKAHLDLVLDLGNITAARVDTDLRHTWVHNGNPDGPSDEDILGKRDDELFPAEIAAPTMALKREVRETGEAVTREITFQKPDRNHTYEMRAAPIFDEDGEVEGVMHGAVDTTEQALVDQQLMVTYRILRHDLRNRLTALLGRAEILHEELQSLEHLEGTRRLLADLTAAADDLSRGQGTEEIQETVTSLKQNVEEIAAFPAPEVREIARTVEEIARDMATLDGKIDRFLKVSKSSRPRNLQTDLRPTIERLCVEYREQYPEASLEFSGPDDVIVRGTAEEIELAIGELIENAIVHSETSSPAVEVEISDTSAGRVAIQVRDSGPGLPTHERPNPEDKTELRHGTGVGLWIVKWVTARLGGPFEITDNEPTGTVATVNLARAEAA